MLFSSSEDSLAGDKYSLVVESARFGDRNGFSSIWLPERHFTRFGALFPNPAVLHAALAMTTSRIRLNAGSVVAPLHNPLRIAEEWAIVDNLSKGRIGISFASGWNPNDFAFFPERYGRRHDEMYRSISTVQRLWRGEAVEVTSGNGEPAEVRIYPTPYQKELPLWITAAGNPKTYAAAGRLGANLLTHILDQDAEKLAEKIAIYRQARAEAGLDPAAGEVSLMLHTFVGDDLSLVREQARRPFCEYIKSNIGLLGGVAESRGRKVDLSQLPESNLDEFVSYLYDRFASTRGLIGTPESCLDLARQLDGVGIDEIACLLDFGPEKELILSYLPCLNRLKELHEADRDGKQAGASVTPEFARVHSNAMNVEPGVKPGFSADGIRSRCTEEWSGTEFHSKIERHGIEIDPQLRFIERVWRCDGEALAQVRLPDQAAGGSHHIHPAYLDSCGRIFAAALPGHLLDGGQSDFYLPAGVRSFRLHKAPAGLVWSHAVLRSPAAGSPTEFAGDVFVYDEFGNTLLEIEGLRFRRSHAGVTPQIPDAPGADLLYACKWMPAGSGNSSQGDRARRRWLIVGGGAGTGKRLAELLDQQGARSYPIEENSTDQLYGLIAAAFDKDPAIDTVVHLSSLDLTPTSRLTTEALRADQEIAVRSVLDLIQSLASITKGERVRTFFITRGAVPISLQGDSIAISQSPVSGFAKAAAIEHPNLWGGLIDLDPDEAREAVAQSLLDALSQDESEELIAVRGGQYYVPRLEHESAEATPAPLRFSEDATFLITGGFGGLGRKLAVWLAEHGAKHLCLASRRAEEGDSNDFIREMRNRGVEVVAIGADVARQGDCARIIGNISMTMPRLRGVFHLAGNLDDALLINETWPHVVETGSPKVEGAWNLHLLTAGLGLDYFVTFSSAASLLTMPGQANYSMANTFLDALAHYRRSLGLSGLAINWGPWTGSGHAETDYGRKAHARLDQMGIRSISPDVGLKILETLLGLDKTQTAVISADWSRFFETDGAISRMALLNTLARKHKTHPGVGEDTRGEALRRLAALPRGEHRIYLMNYLSQEIIRILKLDHAFVIEPRQKLFDLGLDSIMALALKNRLEKSFDRPFNATLLFLYPTLESLTEHLLAEAVGSNEIKDETIKDQAPEVNHEQPNVDALSETEMVDLLLKEIEAGAH
jgi:natural product biosynthesis luciferase-like monooxygenase protein